MDNIYTASPISARGGFFGGASHTLRLRKDSALSNNERSSQRLVERLFSHDHLDRALQRPQITGIAFSGTIGIGLFISSGELIAIGGSLGCMLGFVCAGFIVIGVMRSLAELVSVNPTHSALITYPKVFVDDALGFAVGVIYWLALCISMACLTSAAARVANNFHPTKELEPSQIAGIIVGLFLLTLGSNICGIKIYGNLERVFKWIKLFILLGLAVLMVIINLGVGGYPTESATRNISDVGLTPYFNPFGFRNLSLSAPDAAQHGIPGSTGRFLAVWTCITLAVFACMGGDIVIMAAGEAAKPRRDLPAAAQFIYLAPIIFYVLDSFLVGFNINYTDPDISRIFIYSHSRFFPSSSPFVIVLKYTSLAPQTMENVLSALFMFSAYTAANTALFAASRGLFALARTYGNNFVKRIWGRTNPGHTPIMAILSSSIFGTLAFLGLADDTFDQPILSLSSFFTGAIGCVYASECLAYIRYWQGHQKLEAAGHMSRISEKYREKHYTPRWQPIWAIIGFVGCILIVLFTGWPAVYIMTSRYSLENPNMLKPNRYLAWDILGAYSGPFIFISLFTCYKIFYRTRFKRFEDFMNEYHQPDFEDDEDVQPRREMTVKDQSMVDETISCMIPFLKMKYRFAKFDPRQGVKSK